VDYRKEFVIPFVGLNLGEHQFELEVNDKFFEYFEYSELHHGLVKATVHLDKQERMMVFSFHFKGNVAVVCDRCGEDFMFPLSGDERLIVKYGPEYKEESDDMIIIPPSEYKLDLAPFIYEYLHLILPVRIIHSDDEEGNTTCNPDILERIAQLTPHTDIDPRWEALSKLKAPLRNKKDTGTAETVKKKK
jgi:uncharacterized protein